MTNYKTPTYTPIAQGVYRITNQKGRNRYRVRKTVNGIRYDKYFTNKSKAMDYRKSLA